MSTAAGRKKSIISSNGPIVDGVPVANNTLLNKAASQSTSLYQQCSALRSRLMRVQHFPDYFSLASNPEPSSARRSTDPVTQLWDCFALGVPLCFLLNLLPPPVQPVAVDTAHFDPTNDRVRKRAIAQFAMGVRQVEGCGTFTVTDLWDRTSTDGFVKVVNIVSVVVDTLPEDVFTESPPSSPPTQFSAKDSNDSLPTELASAMGGSEPHPGANVTKELLHTERKYVQDLETMQQYSNALAQTNLIDQDTIHLLFPNLNKLLNFQRRLLIKMESIAEFSWTERRWGTAFTEFEEEFAVYESYCANYTNASDILLQEEANLEACSQKLSLDSVLNVRSELPAFLIKPVQRVCKYPLLIESLIKALAPTDYAYLDELRAGLATAKRITDKVNEEQRRAENRATVKNLEGRVEDWKGHHISNFGTLLLDDIFIVTKSDMDREYHVFLFEKIILCCKEYVIPPGGSKKVGKSNSILKKQGVPTPLNLPGGPGGKKKSTPLLLKGRIFLNNVTSAVPKNSAGQYSLAVYWKGDDDLEYFTLRCRNEEQLNLWEQTLNRLIQDVAARRNSDRNVHSRLAQVAQVANSTNPAPAARQTPFNYTSGQVGDQRTMSMFSQTTSYTPSTYSAVPHPYSSHSARYPSTQASDEQSLLSSVSSSGPQGYPPYTGFDDVDPEDGFEDYPPTQSLPTSGRGTPLGARRSNETGYFPQTRGSGGVSPLPPNGPASAFSPIPSASRPPIFRSSASNASDTSSFNGGHQPSRVALKSQFSSMGLKTQYDNRASGPSPQPSATYPTSIRSRSASQPSAYVPRTYPLPPPPLPTAAWIDRGESKRGSGSSQSTQPDSSDGYSPHTSSPITPYGSSESSLANGTHGRYDKMITQASEQLQLTANVKVKVHFHEDIFVVVMSKNVQYEELVEKVGKKIRLCGPRRDDGPLRVKYRDEDGDLVSLGSTEDVQMAFESMRPATQVTLFVQ